MRCKPQLAAVFFLMTKQRRNHPFHISKNLHSEVGRLACSIAQASSELVAMKDVSNMMHLCQSV